MVKVAIVYYSGYGHTKKIAEHIAEGVKETGSEVLLLTAQEAENRLDELDKADAIIFGSPTYMASIASQLKSFMEKTSARWAERKWVNKIAAGFTNSGSFSGDKLNSLIQISCFAAQHGMIWVGLDMIGGNNTSKGSSNDLNRLGSYLGLMAQSNNDEGPETAPIASDLKTASLLGKRVAEITKKFK